MFDTQFSWYGYLMGVIIIFRKLIAMMLTSLLLLGAVLPAANADSGLGQWIWWNDEGNAYTTFGGNAGITIHTGKMQIIPSCAEGNPDGLTSWTDLYIVESGSVNALSHGDELEDAGGGDPNTVMSLSSGIFISETIGYTGPDGKIPPGEYAIVFDECQDGKFDYLVDGVIDPAFKVEYTTGFVPPLDLTQLKEDAGKLAERWKKYEEYADKLFKLQKAADAGRNPNEKFVDFLMRSGLQDPRTMALLQLANQSKHYQGIKDDPPDPDYKHITPLGERLLLDFQSSDPVDTAMQNLVNDIAKEQAMTRQMWTQLERYQGAQATGDVNWALVHGKALSDNINLLLYQLQFTSASLSRFNQAFAQDNEALNEKAAGLTQLQDRVAASGFTNEELQYFASLGFTESEIAQFKSEFTAMDFDFSKQNMLAEGSAIIDDNNVFGTNLVDFGGHVVGLVNQLLQDPTVVDDAPYADAGGPYSGKEGAPVTFKGTWSTSDAGIAAYDWDLDSDGFFDDAQGVQVTHTFTKPINGLVGLRVTDNNGKQAIHYAQTVITDVNRAPLLVEQSPPARQVQQYAGEAASFEITAIDPDNDLIAVEWFVDGATVGTSTGNKYTYVPDSVGLHAVEAIVSDSNPLGGAFRISWTVKAVQKQPPAAIHLTPDSASLSIGAEHTIKATVLDQQGQPVIGTPVSLVITGANPGTYRANTDDAGVAAFQYTGTKTGEDRAVAQAGSLSSSPAVVVWSTEDVTAPSTTAALSPAEPDGTGGYYRSPVTVAFTVDDEGSGAAKTEYRVNEGDWEIYSTPVTFSADGAYTISYRSTDNAGNVEAEKQVSFRIGASEVPQAFFNPVTAGKNVALLEERAKIEAVSGNYDSGHSAENMLKFNHSNPWATKSKDNQWVKISLADGESYLIDRIQIRPRISYAEQRVKDFEVAISNDSLTEFTTVVSGTLENNGELQEFKLPKPMFAKYILYKPLSSQGNGSIISTQQLKAKTGQIGGETVTFQNLSTDKNNDIVSYEWNFGDNSPTSNVKEPTHTFPGPGTYPVTLTVTDSQGQSSSFTLEQTIEPADFEFLPRNPKEGELVTLINTTAGGDQGLIASSTWDFGDRSYTDYGMSVSKYYHDSNTYMAALDIVMKDGKKYQVKKPITPSNVAPVVDTGRAVTVLGGQRYEGTTRIIDPARDDRHTCVWDFDDGTTSTKCHFDHAYPALAKDSPDKTYTPTVTVTDDDGGVGTDTFEITVRAEQTPRQIAYYTFDGDFKDSSGNGNHGASMVGNPTFAEGIIGQAAKFDGKSGVLVEDSDSLDLATSFSFSMWIYKENGGTGGYAPILSKGHTENYGPYSFLHDGWGDSPGMRLVSGDRNGYTHLFPNTPMPDKEWYMSTVTWDGTTAKYYINGVYKTSFAWKGIFENTNEKLTIGFDPPGATEYFHGMMDDFRMYNYPLTEAEVEDLYELKNPAPADIAVSADPAILNAGQSSTVTAVVKDADGQTMPGQEITFSTTLGTITQTAVTDANGAATAVLTSPIAGTAKVKAQSSRGAFGETTVQFTNTNTPPVAQADSVQGHEDQPLSGELSASDADGDDVTFSLVDQPLKGTISINPSGQFTYVPGDDWNGTDSFSFKVNDGKADSEPAVLTVTIDPVNDAPSFNKGEDQAANKADTTQGVKVPDWAADISAGPADESGQALAFSATNDRNDLFAVQPAVTSDGTLSFTPAKGVSGTATVSVVLKDDGGTSSGGVNASAAQTFTITVDSIDPDISADFSTEWTNDSIRVAAEFDGTGSAITAAKWAAGVRTAEFFAAGGSTLTGNSFTVTSNGSYTLYAKDEAGNEAVKVITIGNIDKVAPVTEASVNPAGPNGWHTVDAVLTLSAADDLSGVAKTEYRINNGEWAAYTGAIPAFHDGEYRVDYRSVDNAGNVEAEQSVTIRVDTTAPSFTVSLNHGSLWPPNHKMVDIIATLDFADAASGIASVELTSITSSEPDDGLGDGDTANDIQGADYGTPDTRFSLRAERSGQGTGRVYTVTYTITDHAGNQSVQSVTLKVQHDNSDKPIKK